MTRICAVLCLLVSTGPSVHVGSVGGLRHVAISTDLGVLDEHWVGVSGMVVSYSSYLRSSVLRISLGFISTTRAYCRCGVRTRYELTCAGGPAYSTHGLDGKHDDWSVAFGFSYNGTVIVRVGRSTTFVVL